MKNKQDEFLDKLYKKMLNTHFQLSECKTEIESAKNRARFETLCEVQDLIREVMESE